MTQLFDCTDHDGDRLEVESRETASLLIRVTDADSDRTVGVIISREPVAELNAALASWLGPQPAGDRLRELNSENENLRDQLAARNEEVRNWREETERLRTVLANRDGEVDRARGELAKCVKELRHSEERIASLTDQVEEMSVSPLNLTQQQRVRALTSSREAVEELGSSNLFGKGGKKASLAGVLSTAHFIVSGDRDYVVTDGEYIQRQHGEVVPPAVEAEPVGPGGPAPFSNLDEPVPAELDSDG